MKKKLLFIIILSIHFSIQAQITFQKGYFIDSLGVKTECLIKDVDWKNNPLKFSYKLTENSEIETADITNVIEFGIPDVMKYITYNGNIDKSSDNPNYLSRNRNPNYSNEHLFLKALVEGNASLYYYEDSQLRRFFYKINGDSIKPLVHKQYFVAGKKHDYIGQNNLFRFQLSSDLECNKIESKEFKSLMYTKKELSKIFLKYNNCINKDYDVDKAMKKRSLLGLSPNVETFYGTLKTYNNVVSYGTMKFNGVGYSLGLEAEFILPYRKNKWAFIVEPKFQSFTSNTINSYDDFYGNNISYNVDVNYKSIEIPIGLRHRFFLSDKESILFLNACYVLNYPTKSSGFSSNDTDLFNLDIERNIMGQNKWAIGLGYHYKRYSFELNYSFKRDLLSNYTYWSSDYNKISVSFGYKLL